MQWWGPLKSLVSPRVGEWIEIQKNFDNAEQAVVSPRVGEWIEIRCNHRLHLCVEVSLRLGEWESKSRSGSPKDPLLFSIFRLLD